MAKSRKNPEVEREKESENHNHKIRREQKKLETELARQVRSEEDYDDLYDEDIQTFQKLKKGR